VFATPSSSTRGLRRSAIAAAAAFPGIVTENPAHSGPDPATRAGNASASHSIGSYRQPVSPQAA
jgi:hypothetical protein